MPKTNDIRDRVHRELDRLVPATHRGDRPGLLLALSGGSDSVALLLLTRSWAADRGVHLAAAHFNHLLRGSDSDRDAAFCRDLCADIDVPLHLGRAPDSGATPSEDTLRRLRRTFLLTTLADDDRLDLCATGHHRDDQTETLLMRLFRGTGPEGFRGILPRAGVFIHPLLPCGGEELRAWLEREGQPWRHDASNSEGDNLRARMRRELMPVLRNLFGPAADRGPARFAALVAEDAQELDRQAQTVLAEWREEGLAERCLPLVGLRGLPRPLGARLIRSLCTEPSAEPSPLEATHIEGLLDWLDGAESGSRRELSGGWSVLLEFATLRFVHATDPATAVSWRLETRPATAEELRNPLPEIGLTSSATGWRLTCPLDSLRGEPTVRAWREGERLRPLGLAGHKKISDLLREQRVPASSRAAVPVVADDDGPFWLVGLTRDERTRLLPSTGRGITLLVDVHPGDDTPVEP